ncbi:MAG: DGC domain protein [Candidatus Hydrogenedentes bacterium ADurb.Bin179]|nr:MAG: DGC domain protein [Candidatus Hydrogenedentes bacterium ADurb.Bin179]
MGELCDKAARVLAREGVGKMYCLAGVGAGIDVMVANARSASASLALDGCAMDCARKTLEKAGVDNIVHLRVSDHGFEKGKSPVIPENVERLVSLARPMLTCRPE